MVVAEKLDMYKAHKADYAAPKKPVLLNIEPAQYLSIDGTGKPGGEEFIDAVAALYAMAFTIKMTYKTYGRDYTICKLEAVWFIDGNKDIEKAKPNQIHYTLMIRTPDFIKNKQLVEAKRALASRGKAPRAEDVVLNVQKEGKCVQMLHIGPYNMEHESFEQMVMFADENGLAQSGKRHEVYLSDPRRVPPERLRTILRLPVQRKRVGR